MTYEDKLKAIAVRALNTPPQIWLAEYLKFRGDYLLRELRTANKDSFETIQGSLDENDRLMRLIESINKVNDPENNG